MARRSVQPADYSRARTLVTVRCGAEEGRCGRVVATVLALPGEAPFTLNSPTRKGAEPPFPRCPHHGLRHVDRARLDGATADALGGAGVVHLLV